MLVGYARVSTQDQKPELQLDALRKAGCERIFSDKASGAQRDRPELSAALSYMRDGAGDVLVVWKLDRLARSLKQLIETVEDLGTRGIGFRSLTEAIDTTSAGGRLTFHIFGAMAEFERSIIRERTRAGLDAARARGRRVAGRQLCPPRMSQPPKPCCPIPPSRWTTWLLVLRSRPRRCTVTCRVDGVLPVPSRADLSCEPVQQQDGMRVDDVLGGLDPEHSSLERGVVHALGFGDVLADPASLPRRRRSLKAWERLRSRGLSRWER